MKLQYLLGPVAAILAFGTPLMAQPPISAILLPAYLQQTYTTGMVGFTVNQTARLNVLNLNPVPATAQPTANNCTVELQFFDEKSTLLKQFVVPNFAPGTATSFDLPRSAVTSQTSSRAQIRGVVVVNPAPTPVGSPATTGPCSVMTTLEIFDAVTGSTVSLTSDTRAIGSGFLGGILSTMPLR